jgi:hypothetical protein
MKEPDEIILSNLCSLKNDSNFRLFVAWIEQNLNEAQRGLIFNTSERLAGQAQVLMELMDLFTNCKDKLNDLKVIQDRIPRP